MRKSLMPARNGKNVRLVPALILVIAISIGVTSLFPVTASSEPGGVTLSDRYGACASHLIWDDAATQERELAAMEEAGIKWLRFGFAWCDMEPTRGNWNFELVDRAVEKARAHGIQILGILGGTPGFANGNMPFNYPPTDIPAWQNYITTVTTRYRGKVSAWEIWNEENIHGFWMPNPTPTLSRNW